MIARQQGPKHNTMTFFGNSIVYGPSLLTEEDMINDNHLTYSKTHQGRQSWPLLPRYHVTHPSSFWKRNSLE